MSYTIKYKSKALKYLEGLEKAPQRRVRDRILKLAEDPRGPGTIALENRDGYRIRIGSYRVVYTIDDGALIVLVLDVDHRRDVYR